MKPRPIKSRAAKPKKTRTGGPVEPKYQEAPVPPKQEDFYVQELPFHPALGLGWDQDFEITLEELAAKGIVALRYCDYENTILVQGPQLIDHQRYNFAVGEYQKKLKRYNNVYMPQRFAWNQWLLTPEGREWDIKERIRVQAEKENRIKQLEEELSELKALGAYND